jgi:hypothetical protein
MKYFSIFIFSVFVKVAVSGQGRSPQNFSQEVNLSSCNCTMFSEEQYAYFNNDSQIAKAINFGRRHEEVQFELSPGILGNFVLPADYATKSEYAKALFLINSERIARANIPYPNGMSTGFPFQGIDANLNGLALTHANYLATHNTFDHLGNGEEDSFARLNSRFGSTIEFLSRSENLYASCGGADTHIVEQAIYSWLYQDSGANWGHRSALLLQGFDPDVPSELQNGFKNNFGANTSEGFFGMGILKNINTTSYTVICGVPVARIGKKNTREKNAALRPQETANIVVFMVVDPALTFVNAPLPVSLISFEVKNGKNNSAILNWKTSQEKSNSGFEIQKSENGSKFSKIGFIAGKLNSNETQAYEFTDKNNIPGVQYYRLKQIDLDGKSTYSAIKAIKFENTNTEVVLGPNPAQKFISISKLDGINKVDLFDFSGKLVKSEQLNSTKNNYNLEINNLPNGAYFMKIHNNEYHITKKIIISN